MARRLIQPAPTATSTQQGTRRLVNPAQETQPVQSAPQTPWYNQTQYTPQSTGILGGLEKFGEGLGQFGIGVGKGALSTIRGAAQLGEKGLTGTLKAILPKQAESTFGLDQTRPTGAEQLIPEKAITPVGGAQKAGKFVEQVAEYFIPASRAAKAERWVNVLSQGIKSPLTAAITRIAGKSAISGLTAGGIKALQIGEVGEEAKKTALTAGAIRAGIAIIGEGARALHIPERIYQLFFKNSASDMKAELSSKGLQDFQRTDPQRFNQFVKQGIIEISDDGTPLLNDTLAEQALDKGLKGSISTMGSQAVRGTLESEYAVRHTVANNPNVIIKIKDYQKLTNVLDDVADRYAKVGNGELSNAARMYAQSLRTGVQIPITQIDRLLPQPSFIPLPSRFPAASSEVMTSAGHAPEALNPGTLNAENALTLRRLLDRLRFASTYDTTAPLSVTQSNFKYWTDMLRGNLADNVPGLKPIMNDYSFYIEGLLSLAKEGARRGNTQILSLIDSIFLSGAYGGNNPVPLFTMGIGRKMLQSTPVTYAASALKKGGETLSQPISSALQGLVSAGSGSIQSAIKNLSQRRE